MNERKVHKYQQRCILNREIGLIRRGFKTVANKLLCCKKCLKIEINAWRVVLLSHSQNYTELEDLATNGFIQTIKESVSNETEIIRERQVSLNQAII